MDKYDELYHYGVLGMKWGIRRNARLLASRRRNVEVRKAKDDYYNRKIDYTTKNERIRKANDKRKQTLDYTKENVKRSSKQQLKETSEKLSAQVVKEVPNHQLKKGAAYANEILSKYDGISFGVVTAAGVASANPVLVTAGVTGMATTAAYAAGRNWVLDNLA